MENFDELIYHAKKCKTPRVSVAVSQDEDVLLAIDKSYKEELIEPVLVGCKQKIEQIALKLKIDLSPFQIIHQPDNLSAVKKAVELVKSGEATLLMKGLINTADLLKAVLEKDTGLRSRKALSHVAVVGLKNYHKLLLLTDAGINIEPNLKRKVEIINNTVEIAQVLQIENPKVAALAAIEMVNPDMKSTIDAAALSKMCQRGQIKNCIVDGPLAFDNAISRESAKHKGIESEVAGEVDILLTPNIDTGNLLYKTFVYAAQAKTAAIVAGAKVPIITTSRSDSAETKIYSIALGVLMSADNKKQ